MNKGKSTIPFVELYRPTRFDDIVLDSVNKTILTNIIETEYFPNLLFYGPPGTGKTTTIINLINSYQERKNQKHPGLCIHLNASDERGIDIIRNQINSFVNSKNLFHTLTPSMKFVVLDEVDYMTKNAQQALRYMLQNYSSSVRFCLICNYISRIDEGLQHEFVKLRFNQLPTAHITRYLKNIVEKEHLSISDESLQFIQKIYKSDLRSMINYLQSSSESENCIINDEIFKELYNKIESRLPHSKLYAFINQLSITYNIDKKNIIKYYLNFVIRNYPDKITSPFLSFVENAMHSSECDCKCFTNYVLSKL